MDPSRLNPLNFKNIYYEALQQFTHSNEWHKGFSLVHFHFSETKLDFFETNEGQRRQKFLLIKHRNTELGINEFVWRRLYLSPHQAIVKLEVD